MAWPDSASSHTKAGKCQGERESERKSEISWQWNTEIARKQHPNNKGGTVRQTSWVDRDRTSYQAHIQGWGESSNEFVFSTNEKWFGRRKMLTPAFHFNVLKDYQEIFSKEAQVSSNTFIQLQERVQIMLEQLEAFADTGREIDLFPYVKRCALDIICGEFSDLHFFMSFYQKRQCPLNWTLKSARTQSMSKPLRGSPTSSFYSSGAPDSSIIHLIVQSNIKDEAISPDRRGFGWSRCGTAADWDSSSIDLWRWPLISPDKWAGLDTIFERLLSIPLVNSWPWWAFAREAGVAGPLSRGIGCEIAEDFNARCQNEI